MDLPPPDPQKLLAHWNEWERGEVPPGQVMSNLKTGGLRTLLEQLVQGAISVAAVTTGTPGASGTAGASTPAGAPGTTEAATATGSSGSTGAAPASEPSGTGTGGPS